MDVNSNPASENISPGNINLDDITSDNIECVEEIGSGSWGNVYKALCNISTTNFTNEQNGAAKNTTIEVAIKAICVRGNDLKENRTSKLIEKHIAKETYIHSLLNHVNIVKLYTTINSIELSGYFYFIMEYVPGQNLFDLISLNPNLSNRDSKLNDLQITDILLQTAIALEYCHSMCVMHRDVKLENILYNPSTNEVKLIDFGLACIFKTPLTPTKHGNCGTAEYQAYEMVCNIAYDERVDIWALGIVFFELLTGQTPFYADSFKQIETNIKELVIKRPDPKTTYSDDQWDIIHGLLNRDRAKRISLAQLAMFLHYLKAKIL